MKASHGNPGAIALALLMAACSAHPGASPCDGEAALSTCLKPRKTSEYYAEQSVKYFDTLDASADPASVPNYAPLVARWEWPPWLLLTGFGRDEMTETDRLLTQQDQSMVPIRECRAFGTQPFGRCHVSFQFKGGPCPIYEEFTFNDAGEMTFIEAWSDVPALAPFQLAPFQETDRWAEAPGIHRLSTKLPGLGNAQGRIDLDAAWMRDAAAKDPEIADFVVRGNDFWSTWTEALQAAGPDLYARGCGW